MARVLVEESYVSHSTCRLVVVTNEMATGITRDLAETLAVACTRAPRPNVWLWNGDTLTIRSKDGLISNWRDVARQVIYGHIAEKFTKDRKACNLASTPK